MHSTLIPVSSQYTLKPLAKENKEILSTLFNHPKIEHTFNADFLNIKDDASHFMQSFMAETNFAWVIFINDPPARNLGICPLRSWNKKEKSIEIWSALLPAYWGNGIMFQCLSALLDKVRKELPIETIKCYIDIHNHRAIKLAARLGFTKTSADNQNIGMIKSLGTNINRLVNYNEK